MWQYKKGLIFCFLLFLFAFNYGGCAYSMTPAATNLYAPHCIASRNVPFADNLNTHQWDQVSLVERDTYGRTYYTYQTLSVMLQHEIEIHIIAQSESEDRTYGYYEDICYIIRDVNDVPFSENDIIDFKTRNHWNRPLIHDEIQYTSYETYHLPMISEKELNLTISQWLDIGNESGIHWNALESYGNTQLIFVEVFSKEDQGDTDSKFYLIGYQENQIPSIIICEEIPFSLTPQEEVQAARRKFIELQ